jgi:hypothetical protein
MKGSGHDGALCHAKKGDGLKTNPNVGAAKNDPNAGRFSIANY